MDRKRLIIAAALLVVAAGLFFLGKPDAPPVSSESSSSRKIPITPADPPVAPIPSRIAMQPPKAEELAQVPPNPMAAAIGSDKVTPEKEVAIVLELFRIYRREFGAFPSGETNAQFMNALRGANPNKLPIFPLDHPRLDPKGNLLDRWQRRYIFHAVSRDRLEIRSTGPDQEIFTADDLVVPR